MPSDFLLPRLTIVSIRAAHLAAVECGASGTMSIILLVSTFFTTFWYVLLTRIFHFRRSLCSCTHRQDLSVHASNLLQQKSTYEFIDFSLSLSDRTSFPLNCSPLFWPIFFSILFWVPLGYPLQNIFTDSPWNGVKYNLLQQFNNSQILLLQTKLKFYYFIVDLC